MDPAAIKDLIASIPNWGWSVPAALLVIIGILVMVYKATEDDRLRKEYKRLAKRANDLRLKGDTPRAMQAARKAANIALRFKQKGKPLLVFWPVALLLLFAGCKTVEPVVQVEGLGRMVEAPAAGESLVIPELKPPALRWFLVDDVWIIENYGVEVD